MLPPLHIEVRCGEHDFVSGVTHDTIQGVQLCRRLVLRVRQPTPEHDPQGRRQHGILAGRRGCAPFLKPNDSDRPEREVETARDRSDEDGRIAEATDGNARRESGFLNHPESVVSGQPGARRVSGEPF